MSKESGKKKSRYSGTLLLPKTSFGMKANLLQKEPEYQKRWESIELYQRLREVEYPKGKFVFHDGPPYANGSIHLGHLLNKILKDLVVRTRTMAGYDVEFVPGWDCHGLPIEHKVMKDLGEKAKTLVTLQIRKRCQDYAEKYVKLQRKQMQRLGTLGSYDDPYLTMVPSYEAGVLDVFKDLVKEGLVYRALKPVHWSIANETALAEAELEYYDREDDSIYVLFDIVNSDAVPEEFKKPESLDCSLMIWTTTPWTIPANLAVAAAPRAEYSLYRYEWEGRERATIVAEDLAAKVFSAAGVENYTLCGRCRGQDLAAAELKYKHPFINRVNPVVLAEYVTLEDGTGLVHTAPGHGAEDYQTGLREGLDVYCPVKADGTFDDTAPEWLRGFDVWKANELVLENLRASAHLFHHQRFKHSYPHDWRSKTPTIFRATEQWFVAVDLPFGNEKRTLRERALDAVEREIEFIPAWGRKRLHGMLESRPDWCISRQRAWGLPIPAFLRESGEALMTPLSVAAVRDKISKEGSDYWFRATPAELLSEYDPADDEAAPEWARSAGRAVFEELKTANDIFDVWFESGSSWNSVLETRDIGFPADLYLEGSDQHRGWFQLSLLPALGARGVPPFKALLTHGFMVDAQGGKMSKSIGNTVEVDDLLKEYGADICRWWVSSLNYSSDIKVDWEFFRIASEEYRKVRNTFRFMLGCLNGFDPEEHARYLFDDDKHTIDAWAARELNTLIDTVRKAYETHQYKVASESIFNFCNETLSAGYLKAVKDRLYCDLEDSERRRRTQTVLYRIVDVLSKLMAPILVHTAEEIHFALRGLSPSDVKDSVHLKFFPEPEPLACADWDPALKLRDDALRELERSKTDGLSDPLDAGISAILPSGELEKVMPFERELADLCGVSRVTMQSGDSRKILIQDLRGEPQCERSWKRDGTVKERSDGGFLSNRDAETLGVE